jgi:nucleoside-diphosphate-sugar epimerase
MHILVTGGSGRIGRFTVAHLLSQGHQVRILDREAESNIGAEVLNLIQGADYQQVDITDYTKLRPYFDGMDAVVHLAAIPYPIPDKDVEIYDINCGGTFNVYQAAAEAGIRRVVSASSINALGNGFGVRPIPVYYFPIDEDHPTWTSDIYSFSKQLVEETAAYFWRRKGISGVCMRFPWVYDPAWMQAEEVSKNFRRMQEEYQILVAMSDTEREATLQSVLAQIETLRQQRSQGEITLEEMFQKMRAIPYRTLFISRKDFWALLDVRDAAHAIHLALTAEYDGSHTLNIADRVNSTGLPTVDLAALFYPEVTTWKWSLSGTETLFSIDKARDLIGFGPQHSISHLVEVKEGKS